MQVVAALMLEELTRVSGWTKLAVCRWLCTPGALGGYGLAPYADIWLQKTVIAEVQDADLFGYAGLFDQAAAELGLDTSDAASLVYRRLRGVPSTFRDQSGQEVAKARSYRLMSAAIDKRFEPAESFPLAPKVQATLSAVAVELLQMRLADAVAKGEPFEDLLIKLSPENIDLWTRVKAVCATGVQRNWLTGRLPFVAPKVATWADRWLASESASVMSRYWGGLLGRSKVGNAEVVACAVFVASQLKQNAQSRRGVLFRD